MFRLFRSAAFRFTLLYIVTFGASVTGLLIIVYTEIIGSMEEDLKHSIEIQLADLGRKFVVDKRNETAASITNILEKDEDKTLVLMFTDRNGKVLAGNIDDWPGGRKTVGSWIKFPFNNASPTPSQAIATSKTLPGNYTLLVGRKMDNIEHVRELIVEVLYICFGIMVALAAAGGMLLSYTIYRKIDVVNQTFRKVSAGALDARVDVIGIGDEFDYLALHLNQTLNRICELIDGVRDISYNVAHDLRTPLNRLRNRLEGVLISNSNAEQVSDQIRSALQEIDGLVATFNAILRIAQAESGAGIEHFVEFSLSEAMRDAVDLYTIVAEEKSQSLTSNITETLMMKGDRHLLTQTIANLLDNAIKYTPKKGRIYVSLKEDAGLFDIEVSDTGSGIPEALYSKVTQKFYRMEQSRNSPGNGLGLSLVSAAIKLHKGTLSFADNHPGLIVTIRLPQFVSSV